MWRYVGASVVGTSHLARDLPCQDAHCVGCFTGATGEVLWCVAADGAGSARFADQGAEFVCDKLETKIIRWLDEFDGDITALDETVIRKWIARVREQLAECAQEAGVTLRDYACTVSGIIAGPDRSVCFQIGDGAIVVSDGNEDYQTVFWPENGEYVNATYFVTDEHFEQALMVEVLPYSPCHVAVFTDGLLRLALHLASQSVHRPFFDPMFARLEIEPPGRVEHLEAALEHFLYTPAITSRTDDDKTLILATRMTHMEHSPEDDVGTNGECQQPD